MKMLVMVAFVLAVVFGGAGFAFQRSTTKVREGCPGSMVRRALARATKVRSDTGGRHEVLTFVDDAGHDVLVLRARG